MESSCYWEYVISWIPLIMANIDSCCKGVSESLHLNVEIDGRGFC